LLASPNAEKPLGLPADEVEKGEAVPLALPKGLEEPKAGLFSFAGLIDVDIPNGDVVPDAEGFEACPEAVLDPKAGAELPPNADVAGGLGAAEAKGELVDDPTAAPKAEPLLLLKPAKPPPDALAGAAVWPKVCV